MTSPTADHMQSSRGTGLGSTWPARECECTWKSAGGLSLQAYLLLQHTHRYTHVRTHVHSHTRMNTHSHVHTHTCKHTVSYTGTHTYGVAHTGTQSMHTGSHTHTQRPADDMREVFSKSFCLHPSFPPFLSLLISLLPLPSLATSPRFISRNTSPGSVVWGQEGTVKRTPV